MALLDKSAVPVDNLTGEFGLSPEHARSDYNNSTSVDTDDFRDLEDDFKGVLTTQISDR